jgi:beta-glucosidase
VASGGPPSVHPDRWPQATHHGLIDAATEARVETLLGSMSVEEKVGQTIQTDIGAIEPEDLRRYPIGSILAGGDSGPNGDERAPPKAWRELAEAFRAVSLEARPGHTPVPVLFGIDAVHGHNNVVGAVIYPHNIGLGAAHDAALVERIGRATAEEVAATGIDWTFAPTLAVPSDVRWGRTYEGYSSDPALVREYAAAAVRGLQGPAGLEHRLAAGFVAATAKHFLGDGGTTLGEDQGDTRVSEEALIARHAQGYAAAIDAGVLTVMASYSSWQGIQMHVQKALLTDVLKGRMGFQGFVVGDWNAHGLVPGCTAERCPEAFLAGVDMFMAPIGWQALYENLLREVRSGEVPMARLDDAVRRILRVKLKLGLFDDARPYSGRYDLIGSEAHRALAREAVGKSLVLLKNDGVLPIKAGAKVVIAGPAAYDIGAQCGGWTISWQGDKNTHKDFPNGESIAAGLKAAIRAGGGKVLAETDDFAVNRPDVAVVIYGERPYAEMFGDLKLAFYASRTTLATLHKLRARGVPVVSVFLSGRPLWANPELNASNAFVAAWWPGTEGGGVADVLIGDAAGQPRQDFSGRLSFPWPGRPDATTTLFKVGYGLSYATPGKVGRLDEHLRVH